MEGHTDILNTTVQCVLDIYIYIYMYRERKSDIYIYIYSGRENREIEREIARAGEMDRDGESNMVADTHLSLYQHSFC